MPDFKIIACQDCGSEFKVQGWEERNNRRFCSRDCFNAMRLKRNLMHAESGGMDCQDRQ